MARYSEALPSPALRPLVRCYWTFSAACAVPSRRVLPDGCADLLFEFAAHARGTPLDASGEWIGTMTRAVVVGHDRATELFGVRFAPGALHALIGTPLQQLTDASVPVGALMPAWARGLHETLAGLDTFDARCKAIDARLVAAFARSAPPVLVPLLARVDRVADLPSVPQLAAWAGFSERTLQRRFLDAVGLSPKQYLRWLRFARALRLLQRGGLNGADIACELLYADQAHFIGDFRRHAGVSPTAWLAEPR